MFGRMKNKFWRSAKGRNNGHSTDDGDGPYERRIYRSTEQEWRESRSEFMVTETL